jgi:hypothetical protein
MTHPAASIGPIPLPAIFGMRKHGICQALLTYTDFAKSSRLALNACGGHLASLARDCSTYAERYRSTSPEACAGCPRIRAAPHPLQLSSGDG